MGTSSGSITSYDLSGDNYLSKKGERTSEHFDQIDYVKYRMPGYTYQTMAGAMQGKHIGGRTGRRWTAVDNTILGSKAGNTNYRQGIRIGKDGNPIRLGGVTTAKLLVPMYKAGSFGSISPLTGRYREKRQSLQWSFQLGVSTGPNKGPRGFAQSSLDTTRERYTTAETRFEKSGVSKRAEQFDETTKKFERKWAGWEDLKIDKTWKHYRIELAPMFKDTPADIGLARRSKKDSRTSF